MVEPCAEETNARAVIEDAMILFIVPRFFRSIFYRVYWLFESPVGTHVPSFLSATVKNKSPLFERK